VKELDFVYSPFPAARLEFVAGTGGGPPRKCADLRPATRDSNLSLLPVIGV